MGPAADRGSNQGVDVRRVSDQRGGVVGELSFGVTVISILVMGGLFALSQIEGISFAVLLHQLRAGS
jgi:hypothetical protein